MNTKRSSTDLAYQNSFSSWACVIDFPLISVMISSSTLMSIGGAEWQKQLTERLML
ncbi:uncharacterized protein METZ01_LOCUS238076 [marine metagenome]|uniref:Uncharacterized protein n=1 Tax=marine metagenome TaxID=408172 RepID=A0A382HDH7_9ZZZZ